MNFDDRNRSAIDADDHLWVADACNHRIQVFDVSTQPPHLIFKFGEEGTLSGQFRYPYGLVISRDHVYVCEFGNHRIQKFSLDGTLVDVWGHAGRETGALHAPWALAADRQGRIHVLDTYNHRVQRICF